MACNRGLDERIRVKWTDMGCTSSDEAVLSEPADGGEGQVLGDETNDTAVLS